MKVLLLGITNKAGLAVARNLCKYGCTVDVVYEKKIAANSSKYINQSYFLGNPAENVREFVSNLIQYLSSHSYIGMIPLYDAMLEICRAHINDISPLVKIAGLNDNEVYKYSINKYEMLQIGETSGLRVPDSILIQSLDDVPLVKKTTLNFPVIAKPVSSAKIINNKIYEYKVKVCHSLVELIDFIRENVLSVNILVQEFIEGYGIGYNFIAKTGIIQNAYIHRRINENQGVSTLRKSLTTDHYGLNKVVPNTVKNMNWNGVGMMEFMIQPDGTPVLMEFNGRFFGSTELSTRTGINLPVLFLRQFVLNESIPENILVRSCSVRFFHDELILYSSLIFQKKPLKFLKWVLNIVASIFKTGHYFETTMFNDLRFSLAFYRYEAKRWKTKFQTKKRIKRVKINPLIKEDIHGKVNINFYCMGNICRSPFAERYARNIRQDLHFNSSGSIVKENRLSPLNAIEVAKKFNVDLESHQSKSINPSLIDETDLFVVMDKSNYVNLIIRGISPDKIRFLSVNELNDPYGKSIDDFEQVYRQIKSDINRVFT